MNQDSFELQLEKSFSEKRQNTAAVQNLAEVSRALAVAAASWSAAVFCRFVSAMELAALKSMRLAV